jgi:penicillin-binding protein 1A
MARKPRKPASDDEGTSSRTTVRRPRRKKAGKRNPAWRYSLITAGVWILLAGAVLFSHWISQLPDTSNLLAYAPSQVITLVDVKGRTIARRGLVQGEQVQVGELPEHVTNAFIAIEDRRFRWHFGIDPWGTMRALFTDIKEGAFVQGGSTITQQLAKNLFLKPERTLERKIEEAILAVWLESSYSKDEILTLYLNHVYFGAGVYGIEGAAEKFFNKRAADLTLTEGAILAGIVKAPSRDNPGTNRDAAMERARVVLGAMEDAGFIDESTQQQAAATRPRMMRASATPGAGYFVDYVLGQLPESARRANERLVVETTLDLDIQRNAERALVNGLVRDGPKLRARQGALVAMTMDGAIRALVGGRSYDASSYNRATAERQPGSAFKPFVFLAALERGHKPSDTFMDGPVTVGRWRPGNYEGKYEGNITLSRAMARSSNSVAVQLTHEAGPAAVARVARRLGINTDLQPVPALALGTSEVTPIELTSAYTAIANAGQGVMPHAIVRIRTASGKVLYRRRGSGMGRVLGDTAAAQMTAMLRETVATGTGRAAALAERPSAGKTGTTQDFRDAWFVGFTADLVCTVWIGNDNGTSMKAATGGGLPARIFKTFMTEAHAGLPSRPLRGSLIAVASAAPAEAPPVQTVQTEVAPAEPAEKPGGVLEEFESLLDKLF